MLALEPIQKGRRCPCFSNIKGLYNTVYNNNGACVARSRCTLKIYYRTKNTARYILYGDPTECLRLHGCQRTQARRKLKGVPDSPSKCQSRAPGEPTAVVPDEENASLQPSGLSRGE